jgi:hypothetical protein
VTLALSFLVGFFVLPAKERPVPVTIAPRTGGGVWVVLPDHGFSSFGVPKGMRLKSGPRALGKMMPATRGKILFRGVTEGTVGSLTLEDGVFVRVDVGSSKCFTGVMVREPTTALHSKDGYTRVEMVMVETQPAFGCDEPPPTSWQGGGAHGGLRVTIDAKGRVVGIQLVGYLFSMLFVREGETRPDLLRRLGQENREEVQHQAE